MPLDSKSLECSTEQFSGVWAMPAALRQLEESGESLLVEELIEMFQTDTAERLEVLSRAVETADYVTAGQESHTIKGSALQVGATKVAEVCRQMELEARKPQPAELASLLRDLLRSFEHVLGVFAARRRSATDGSPHYAE